MGRQLKRVALDFNHPLNKRWPGFINPWDDHSGECESCEGTGYSEEAMAVAATLDRHGRFEKVRAHCVDLGLAHLCPTCKGNGETFDTPEAEAACEAWEPTEPPAGEGWQMWETVSEGSPISPVFATPEELAHWLTYTPHSWNNGDTSYKAWLRMIRGDGWAFSFGGRAGQLQSGVECLYGNEAAL